MIDRVRLWLRSVLLRRRLEREMQEEMADHLEQSVARLMARGLTEEAARREAVREFGNVAYLQEEGRNARGTRWLDALTEDSRFALRQFRRRWGTALTMFLILASGMVISTLLFTYVHWYATSPPPAVPREPDLVRIRGSEDGALAGRGGRAFTLEEFEEYRRLTEPFRAVAGWAEAMVSVDAGESEPLRGLLGEGIFVTEDYFRVMGVRPILGPGLSSVGPEDPASALVAVLSHAAWDQLLGASPDAIGRTVGVNGVPVTIVGVAPPRFIGVGGGDRLQLWMPLESRHALLPASSARSLAYRAAARLRPGVSLAEATAATQVVAARAATSDERLATRDPEADVVPLLAANGDPMHERDVRLLTIMLGMLGLLVLAVACTNVGALQTGLALARRHEIAVRLSLGAARSRIVRQLLTESALLAVLAGAAALGTVWAFLRTTQAMFPVMPIEMELTWPIAAFTIGVSLAVGMLFGVSPALHATRVAIASALQDSGAAIAGTRLRLQRALVVAQIALTQPLIVLLSAVLLIVLGNLKPADRNEFGDRLIALRLRPATAGPGNATAAGPESIPQARDEMRRLIVRLESLPGVAAAVVGAEGRGELGAYVVHPADRVESGSQEAVRIAGQTAAPGYFSVAGVPLLRGREFEPTDAASLADAAQVPVVVGSDLAGRLWPGADPLGRRLQTASDSAVGAATLVVTGVVADREAALRSPSEPHRIYLPPDPGIASRAVLVRTVGPAESLIPPIRDAVREEVPRMVAGIQTIAAIEDAAQRTFRMVTGGIAGSGLVALLLSAIGLYAVVAFSVGQRTAEIAVRVAVGAPPRRIAGRFVADGLRLSVIGLVLGLPISLFGLRGYNVLAGLDDTMKTIALTPVAVVATLSIVLVTLAATFVPARRATMVSPVAALRRE